MEDFPGDMDVGLEARDVLTRLIACVLRSDSEVESFNVSYIQHI